MKREARVLQQRVQVATVDRRRIEALERVGRKQDEGEEGDRDHRLHRQRSGAQARRQIAAECGDRGAEHGKDQHPHEHRSLVIAPHARDLVEHRLGRVAVLINVGQRKVGSDVGVGQAGEGDRKEERLSLRRRPRQRHQRRVVAVRAPERHDCLRQRHAERQDDGKVSEFGDHGSAPFHWPAAFRESATSLGM